MSTTSEHDEFIAANKRAARFLARNPTAVAARYDRRIGRVVIDLSTGIQVAFSPRDAQGLEHSKPSQLAVIEISAMGLGLHFPALDADLYLPALLKGVLGSRKWMAARAKGKLDGRPTKKAREPQPV